VSSRARHRAQGVVDHGAVDDVGQLSFQAAHGFHRRLADSAFLTSDVIAATRRGGAKFSITARMNAAVTSIDEHA
jgi:hypothetical protein